jgi:hypothetical protein
MSEDDENVCSCCGSKHNQKDDDMILLLTAFHFPNARKAKDYTCSKCVAYIQGDCKGNGLKREEVVLCMADKYFSGNARVIVGDTE